VGEFEKSVAINPGDVVTTLLVTNEGIGILVGWYTKCSRVVRHAQQLQEGECRGDSRVGFTRGSLVSEMLGGKRIEQQRWGDFHGIPHNSLTPKGGRRIPA
jgi:hypothetical protein